MDEFEDPAGGDVLGEQGQFGKGQGEQMMELVDQAGALADDGLESSGDLAEACAVWSDSGVTCAGRSVRAKRAAARASTASDFLLPKRAAR